jgi:general secretion pathway protein J
MAWRGIDGIARSRTIANQRLENTLRLNTVLAQWERDLLALHDRTAVPTLRFDGSTLRLVRDADGGAQVVAWALRGGRWMRWAGPPVIRSGELQDQWLRSQQLLGTEPGQVEALAGASDWQVFFYRGNAWSNAQSTGDVAQPPGNAGSAPVREQLPSGVRLTMTLPEGVLVRDVMLGPQPQ